MEYTFKTKQMIKVAEEIGSFYDLEKAVYDGNLTTLAKLISIFAEISKEQAEDEIDKMLESGKKVQDIYKDIFDGVNKKGFFKQKLQHNLEAPPIDTDKMIHAMYEAQMQKEIAKTTQTM